MARPGIFNLIARDARFAELTASRQLKTRLAAIRAQRVAAGEQVKAPTYADIGRTHTTYVREVYRPGIPLTSEYTKVPGSHPITLDGSAGADRRLVFPIPQFGHFISDIVFHVKLPEIGTAGGSTYYRWAAYPGLRLFKRTAVRSGQVEMDSYDADDAVARGSFRMGPARRPAWERAVGQEESRTATYFNRNEWTGEVTYRDGLQTPKKVHAETDLWIPADFWFCDSVAAAVPSSLIPTTQREVIINLEHLGRMIYAEDGCGTAATLDLTNVKVTVDMYVNNLFTEPEIAQIFQERVGFSVIRTHRSQTRRITENSGKIDLHGLKWPIEYMTVGARDEANASNADQWHLMGRRRVRARAKYITVPVLYYNGSYDQLVGRDAIETSALDPVILTMGVEAVGETMVSPLMPATFYNAYLPNRYGDETEVVAPTDPGAYLIPFNLWPGRRQLSGTLDASAIRDLALVYTATGVSTSAPAEVIVKAFAVNFLVRHGDKLQLRYGI